PAPPPASGPLGVPVVGASLVLGEFLDAPVARLQAEALAGQRPDLLFVVAPIEVDGTVYHRLLAGPAADLTDALEAARARAAELSRVDIPGYVLELPAPRPPGGFLQASAPTAPAPRYRVYAGAYADAHEAAYLAGLLAQRRIQARLIERTGRHVE